MSYHAADNAFPDWPAYNLMIGIGGWMGRNEKAGPYWYFKDGKLVSDPTPGSAGNHGARTPFLVVMRDTKHPITKGLPASGCTPRTNSTRRCAVPARTWTCWRPP